MTAVLLLGGCASYFKRKECEKVNWFEHGQRVAMKGQRLNADPLLNECRKVEAKISESQVDLGFKSGMQKYCEPNYAYKVGRDGDLFSRDLCDGPQIRSLLSHHQRGITDYCQKENGFQAGASGKRYQNVCTPEQEKTFLPQYRKGRKKYVDAVITDKEALIREKETRIGSLRMDKQRLDMDRFTLENRKRSLESTRSHFQGSTTPDAMARITTLDHEISGLDSRLSSNDSQLRTIQTELNRQQSESDRLRQEISELRTERAGLDEDGK